jgi:trans-aconitate methyltransferase
MYVVGGTFLAVVILGLLGAVLVLVVHGYFMLRNQVPFVVMPAGGMDQIAQALGVRDGDVVFDLGCGDGRVLMALHRVNSKARFYGVENDLVVWLLAKLRTRGRVKVAREEIARTPLGEANRIFAYLGAGLMADLEPRFERELKPGARVVSVQFPLPHRAPERVVVLTNSASHAAKLYVYDY